jgi:hypothetical protein
VLILGVSTTPTYTRVPYSMYILYDHNQFH